MIQSVAQHLVVWLLIALLVGVFLEWVLEVWYFRRPLADARDAARRRGEELDSERFAHGRCQAELKGKLAELDASEKGRAVSESLLTAARSKLSTLETQHAELESRRLVLEGTLSTSEAEVASLHREKTSLSGEVLDLRLRLTEQEARLAAESGAASELRANLDRVAASHEACLGRIAELELELVSETKRRQSAEAELDGALAQQAKSEASLGESTTALASLQPRSRGGPDSRPTLGMSATRWRPRRTCSMHESRR
jgi:chromosome segregation ATPase